MATDTVLFQSSGLQQPDKKHAIRHGDIHLRVPERTSYHGPDVPVLEHTLTMSQGLAGIPKAKLSFKIFLSKRVIGGLEMRIINRSDHKVTCKLSYDGPGGHGRSEPIFVKPHGIWYEQLGASQYVSVAWETRFPLPRSLRHR